jgi:HK97 family phage portal protein
MNIIQAILGKNFQSRSADFLDDRFFPGLQDLRPTKIGKYVSLEQCLQNPTVFACCRIRSESVAVLGRAIYKQRRDGGKDLVKRDPRQKVLGKFPNPELTRFEFEQMLIIQDLIYGNAFAQIVRDENTFKPIAMWPLLSRKMEVARDPKTQMLVYRYDIGAGQKRIFPEWEIYHRRGPTLNGILGLSVFELALDSFTLGMALEEYCCRIFENDSTPRGLLVHKAKLDKQTKDIIREEWKKAHGGLVNKGGVGILDMELDYKQVGQNNDVMQFVETMGHQREVICSWFRVPQHMAGILTRSTNNNIQQQSLEFMRDTLAPDLTRIELSYERDLLTEQEKDEGWFIKHRIEDLLRGDIPEQTTQMVQQLLNGIRNVNEVRQEKDLNPVEGGDEYWKPMNIGVLGQPNVAPGANLEQNEPPQQQKDENQANIDENQPENEENPPKKAKKGTKRADFACYKPALLDACRRVVGREVVAFEKKLGAAKAPKEVFDWYEEFQETQPEYTEKALIPIIETIRAVEGTILRTDQAEIITAVIMNERLRSQAELVAKPALFEMSQTLSFWRDNKAARMANDLQLALEVLNHETAS